MKIKKLQQETKEYIKHWKASEDILQVTMERKDLKCIKCNKKVKFTKKEIDFYIKGFRWNKKMKGKTWKALPIQIISPNFVQHPFHILCWKCMNEVQRFIGFIPDRFDINVFPSQLTTMPEGADVVDWLDQKKMKWEIHYKNKVEPYTKQKFLKYLKQACKAYKKKYPYIPYTEKQLVNTIKNHRRSDWL